ncbi:MAG: DUF3667 domain-containing protein [Brevundimonas sp.]
MPATTTPESAGPAGPSRVASCPNCGAGFAGRFCSNCSQAARQPDRVRDIASEWARAAFSLDGILWGTLGDLIAHPARLTRDWWEGRRVKRMSPVRVLLAVALFGSALAWMEHAIVGRAEANIGLLIQVFTYQIAVVSMVVTPWVMPRLLASAGQRSTYEHVIFAMYASTTFGMMSCLAMLLLVFGGYAPLWLQNLTLAVAPPLAPLAVLALFAHAVVHMRGAYGVSWIGALLRTGVLAVCILIASMIVTMVLTFTGVNELWMPGLDEPVARFERVDAEPDGAAGV